MDKFGKYEVLGRIGAGGFGEVFKGYDPMIKRSVAIKICNSDDQQTRRRFELEAEIAGNLSHRNITTIYDYGVEDGTPYLVQELLDGEDLDRKIKRRESIPYPVKLGYLAQIAAGFEHSHAKGVVHRDLKPANVHILPDGTAKIMDYGIARFLHQDSDLTAEGQTVGTTAYLAPEQIRGEELDHRVDIFAFGTLSYELLTYERAFRGDTISSLMYQIVSVEPKSMCTYWPDCPAEVMNHVARCMHKEPDRRPQDFSEIVGELSRIRESSASQELPLGRSSQSASPPSPQAPSHTTAERTQLMPTSTSTRPTRRTAVLVAVVGIVLAAVGAAAWLGWRSDSVEGISEPRVIVEEAAAGDAEDVTAEGPSESPEDTPLTTPEPPPTPPPSTVSPSPTSQPPPPARTAQGKPAAPAIEAFQLVSDPPGARIWVDGRRLTALASVELLPGASYRLRLELESYESVDRSLTLESLSVAERSSRRVSVTMARRARPYTEPPDSEQGVAQPEARPGVPSQPIPPLQTAPSAMPAEEAPPSSAEDPGVAAAAIRKLLDSYEEAYATLDVGAVRRVWPSIDADRRARLEESFSSLRAAGLSQTIDLDCREPTFDGNRASVSCNQTVIVTSAKRRINSAETEVDIDLEKVGASWVMRSLRSG